MRLREAQKVAERLAALMSPFCARVEIAGSVRRCCPEVKDVELVAVPRWDERPGSMPSLFAAEAERVNLLHEWATAEAVGAGVRWIKPGTPEVVDWAPKPEGKYWRALVEDSIKLDLFLASAENYGLILAIRTGCAEFSQALMTYAKHRTPYHVEGGYLRDREDKVLETPEERDVFRALKVDYVEPRERTGQHMVRRAGRPQFPRKESQGTRR
jgi:DNA polymerase/3'-5' exonuclease PolX